MQIKSTDIVGGGGGGPGGPAAIETMAGATEDLLASQASKYLRFTSNSAKTLNVQLDATEELPENSEFTIYNHGNNDLTIVPEVGVTIVAPSGGSLVIPSKAVATLKRVAADVFDLIGQTFSDDAAYFPDMTGNAGKVLGVNGTEDGVEWIEGGGGSGGPAAIQTVATETSNLLDTQASAYVRFTSAGTGKTLTVRPNSTHALPDEGEWTIHNAAANGLTLVAGSGVTITLPDNGTLVIPAGGTVLLKRTAADTFDLAGQTVAAALPVVPYSVPFGFSQIPVSDELLFLHVFAEAVTFADDWVGSQYFVGSNPSATFVLTIQKNGSTIGTISVSTAGVATFATSGGSTVCNVGDRLSALAPTTPDISAGNMAFTLKGTRA